MGRGRVRVRVAVRAVVAFSVWMQFTLPNGERASEVHAIGPLVFGRSLRW
jgi:hypothetical protein